MMIAQQPSVVISDFVRLLVTETEAGFVFFGSKPVCYQKALFSNEGIIGSARHRLLTGLRWGAQHWKAIAPQCGSSNYCIKVTEFSDGLEILCLNKHAFVNTVNDNLALFQYALGPAVNPELLFEAVAKGPQDFYSILRGDATLVGILLGYGSYSALVGGREEQLSSINKARPSLPYRCSDLGCDDKERIDSFQISYLYQDFFPAKAIRPSFGFDDLDKEDQYLCKMLDLGSSALWTKVPRLIFGNVSSDVKQVELVKAYELQQSEISALIDSGEIVERILTLLKFTFSVSAKIPIHTVMPTDLAAVLIEQMRMRQFSDIQACLTGIDDADRGASPRYLEADLDEFNFYELHILKQLQKNVFSTQLHFDHLAHDNAYTPCLEKNVYTKVLKVGAGQRLTGHNSRALFSFSVSGSDDVITIPLISQRSTLIDLNQVIPGFAAGVQGMAIGELREIQIYPAAGYGLITTFEPWKPLKCIVYLESIEELSPPLMTLTLPKPILEPRILSTADLQTLKDLDRDFSYRLGRTFWEFYRGGDQITKAQLIDAFVQGIETSPNLLALDDYSLQIWNQPKFRLQLPNSG